MKMSIKALFVAAAFAFATTSCTEKQAENAETATENAAGEATAEAGEAVDSVKADLATEPGDTAVVLNKEANGVVEEAPAAH